MHKSKGFTLIELVVVIVILGILSTVAAMKYIGIQKDAKHNVIKALSGALNSSMMLAYTKAEIQGVESLKDAKINAGGFQVETRYGYPAGTENGIVKTLDFDLGKWKILPTLGSRRSVLFIWAQGYANNITNRCYVQYVEADKDHNPKIIVNKDACYLATKGKN